jgi:ElaB/YqjD/DUF883 family membrane-anchored ribosome-binding protein
MAKQKEGRNISMEDLKSRAHQAVDEAAETAENAWEQAKGKGRGLWEKARNKGADALEKTEDAVKEYPVQAIAIAALAGLALGVILASRGKD